MTEVLQQKEMKVIVFELMNIEYAIDVGVVQSVERVTSITRVPRTPSYVKGVINLSGTVTPIVDLRERLGLEPIEMDEETRIIIVTLEDYGVGLIVDAANDVIDIPIEAIELQPDVVGTIESDFISGLAKIDKRLFVMLELSTVLEPMKWLKVE